jgi:hypothetical protein
MKTLRHQIDLTMDDTSAVVGPAIPPFLGYLDILHVDDPVYVSIV